MSRKRLLVIAPHADDEILGCGGYLLHKKSDGYSIKVVIATIGGKDSRQDFLTRLREFENVTNSLCVEGEYLYKEKDAILEEIPSVDIITKIDKIIDDFRPNEILVNSISNHQDHRKLYQCAMASLRLKEGYSPDIVMLYEYPFSLQSQEMPINGKVFHDITDVIDKKVELFNLYKSQVKCSPSPLNEKGIKVLASIRGLEIGTEYAELFYLYKMTI